MSDKKKIVILSLIIGFVVILIILVGFIAYLNIVNENKTSNSKLSTTTRRTVPSTSTTSNLTTTTITTTTKTPSTTTSSSTTSSKISTTSKTTTTKKTTSTSKITTKKTTTTTSVIPVHEYEEAKGSTTYTNAVDSWEWDIINLINDEREKNNLNRLIVAKELREHAEATADLWSSVNDATIKKELEGYNNFGYIAKNKQVTVDNLYKRTIQATDITEYPYYKYIGVGVISKDNGYYYIMLYE